MSRRSREPTESEWAILERVWRDQPCAAPTVQEALVDERAWTYSTVKTMMDRMVKKGFLKTERIRNLILYRACISRRQARRLEISRTLRGAFTDGPVPMMQFLLDSNTFSPEELDALEELIYRKRGEGK